MLAALTAALGELAPPPAASSAAAPRGAARARPLVVEWPQVKAFLAMADTALKAKKEEYEALQRHVETCKADFDEALRHGAALSSDSAALAARVAALLAGRRDALERAARAEAAAAAAARDRAAVAAVLGVDAGCDLAAAVKDRLEATRGELAACAARVDQLSAALAAAEAAAAAATPPSPPPPPLPLLPAQACSAVPQAASPARHGPAHASWPARAPAKRRLVVRG